MSDRNDTIRWHAHARVDKYDLAQIEACRVSLGLDREPNGPELLAFCAPRESIEADGNLLTTAGLAKITGLIIAAGGQGWDATHARIGVGDTATAATIADTDLGAASGSTHRQFDLVDTITRSNGVITAVATFGTSVANFHWQEWCIDNGTGAGTTVTATMMNHKITDLGTKTSAATWVFTVTVTLS